MSNPESGGANPENLSPDDQMQIAVGALATMYAARCTYEQSVEGVFAATDLAPAHFTREQLMWSMDDGHYTEATGHYITNGLLTAELVVPGQRPYVHGVKTMYRYSTLPLAYTVAAGINGLYLDAIGEFVAVPREIISDRAGLMLADAYALPGVPDTDEAIEHVAAQSHVSREHARHLMLMSFVGAHQINTRVRDYIAQEVQAHPNAAGGVRGERRAAMQESRRRSGKKQQS